MICSHCKWGDQALERLRVFSSKSQSSRVTANVPSARMAHPHQSRLGLWLGIPTLKSMLFSYLLGTGQQRDALTGLSHGPPGAHPGQLLCQDRASNSRGPAG